MCCCVMQIVIYKTYFVFFIMHFFSNSLFTARYSLCLSDPFAIAGLERKYFDVFFFQAEDGIRDGHVTGVQTCTLPICSHFWFLLCRGSPHKRTGRCATRPPQRRNPTGKYPSSGRRNPSPRASTGRRRCRPGRATTHTGGSPTPYGCARNRDGRTD